MASVSSNSINNSSSISSSSNNSNSNSTTSNISTGQSKRVSAVDGSPSASSTPEISGGILGAGTIGGDPLDELGSLSVDSFLEETGPDGLLVSNDWNCVYKSRNLHLFQKKKSIKPSIAIREYIQVFASPATVIKLLQDYGATRRSWDGRLIDCEVLQTFPLHNAKVVRLVFDGTTMHRARELVILEREVTVDGTTFFIQKSVSHASAPRIARFVRAELDLSGFFVKPMIDKDGSECAVIAHLHQVDPKHLLGRPAVPGSMFSVSPKTLGIERLVNPRKGSENMSEDRRRVSTRIAKRVSKLQNYLRTDDINKSATQHQNQQEQQQQQSSLRPASAPIVISAAAATSSSSSSNISKQGSNNPEVILTDDSGMLNFHDDFAQALSRPSSQSSSPSVSLSPSPGSVSPITPHRSLTAQKLRANSATISVGIGAKLSLSTSPISNSSMNSYLANSAGGSGGNNLTIGHSGGHRALAKAESMDPNEDFYLPFQEIVGDPVCRLYFSRFLQQEFNSENIEFWVAVEAFKNDYAFASNEDCLTEALNVFDQFISVTAPSQVNLSTELRSKLTSSISSLKSEKVRPDMQLFDGAQKHIFELMRNDPYRRFVETDLYMDMLHYLDQNGANLPQHMLEEFLNEVIEEEPISGTSSKQPKGTGIDSSNITDVNSNSSNSNSVNNSNSGSINNSFDSGSQRNSIAGDEKFEAHISLLKTLRWELNDHLDGTDLFKKKNAQPFNCMRLKRKIKCRIEKLWAALTDYSEHRTTWMSRFISADVIEAIDSDLSVIRLTMNPPFHARRTRDFCLLQATVEDFFTGEKFVLFRSISHKQCPESKDILRCRMWTSGFMIQPVAGEKDLFTVTYLSQVDWRASSFEKMMRTNDHKMLLNNLQKYLLN